MDRTERFYRIDQLLRARGVVPLSVFLDELQVSRATFKRDLEYLRDRLNAPVEWDAERRGYCLRAVPSSGPRYELPGVWFSAAEIQALVSMQQMLAGLSAGWMKEQLAPLQARLWAMLGETGLAPAALEARIRVLSPAMRAVEPHCFEVVSQAVIGRSRLQIRYFHRSRNEEQQRLLSPQRLVHYRGNWYVDAWCHWRADLRSFSLDAIRDARLSEGSCHEMQADELDRRLGAGYGIFSGADVTWARLRFAPERARWVAAEEWHPQQRGYFDASGYYLLDVPYSDPRELVMDILRQGPAVEVLEPVALRAQVADAAAALLALYKGGAAAGG